jgi:HSP20 family molecular chaperone IbpA
MSQVPVIALQDPAQLPAALVEERNRHVEEIRRRAFDLYTQRGRAPGHEAEDWRAAECQLTACAIAGVEEDGDQLRIVTRLQPDTMDRLHVIAFPHEIFVEGEAPEHFERFPLPLEINPASVSAALDNNLLTITAKAHRAVA